MTVEKKLSFAISQLLFCASNQIDFTFDIFSLVIENLIKIKYELYIQTYIEVFLVLRFFNAIVCLLFHVELFDTEIRANRTWSDD